MSRQNKVNPDHYKVAGRLSMDDLARERRIQTASQLSDLRGRSRKASPPWMVTQEEPRSEVQAQPASSPSSRVAKPKRRRAATADAAH